MGGNCANDWLDLQPTVRTVSVQRNTDRTIAALWCAVAGPSVVARAVVWQCAVVRSALLLLWFCPLCGCWSVGAVVRTGVPCEVKLGEAL